MKNFGKMVVLSVAGALVAGSIIAQESDNPAVKARQDVMSLRGFYLGQMFAMAKGDVEYNADSAQAAADSLAAVIGLDMSAMWPAGSDSDSISGTRAKANIWSDFGGVMEIAGELNGAVANLQTAAGTDLDALKAALGPVGAACTACHKEYRAPAN